MYKVKSFEEVLAQQKEMARASFGDDFNVSSVSVWNRIFGTPVSMLEVEKSQALKDFEDKLSIYKCSGQDLDDLLGNFLFPRKQATVSTGQWKTINSTPNTIVPIGALTLERSIDGVTYKNTNLVTIDSLGVGIFNISCEVNGAIGNCEIGKIDKVKTPVSGIVSGGNINAIENGQDQETDLEFLARYQATRSSEAYWNLDGIYSEILKVNGVKSAFVDCNRTNTTDSNGWLPHSRVYVVDGGTNLDVAQAIYRKTDRAIEENGDVEVTVKDLQENDRIVRFYRPIEQLIDFKYTILPIGLVSENQKLAIKDYIDSVKIGGLITQTNALEVLRQKGLLVGIQSIEIEFSLYGQGIWKKVIQMEYNKKSKGNSVV